MRILGLSYRALTSCAVIAALAGCGGLRQLRMTRSRRSVRRSPSHVARTKSILRAPWIDVFEWSIVSKQCPTRRPRKRPLS